MYKLLIVEDEEIFRRVLPDIIDWNSIGFVVAGVAENGRKALEILEQLQVDVILTDIRMPVINGLDLADEVRSRYPRTKVLLLTAFNDFDYARKGIDCGVYGYILKSDSEEVITNYFIRLKKVMDEENSRNLSNEEVWTQRDSLLYAISGKGTNFDCLVADEVNKLKLRNDTGHFLITIFELDEYKSILASLGIHRTQYIINFICTYLYSCIERPGNGAVILNDHALCVLWTNIDKVFIQMLSEIFNNLLNELTFITENDDTCITVTCAIGNETDNIGDIHTSYVIADRALKHKVYIGNGQLINGIMFNDESQPEISFADEDKWIKDILTVLHEGSSIKIAEHLDKLEKLLIDMRVVDIEAVSGFCIKLLLATIQEIGRMRGSMEELFIKSRYIIKEINKCTTISWIFAKLKLFLVECVSLLGEGRCSQNRKIVDEAVRYIELNYSGQICLEDVAKHVNVHPVHLSRLFSKDLGKTFKGVLTENRIKAAKKLLCDINYKVYEISEMVGYEKPRYFSELFRATTGHTPLEYREKFISLEPQDD